LVVKSHNGFATVKEMNNTLEDCYDKSMEDKMAHIANVVFRIV